MAMRIRLLKIVGTFIVLLGISDLLTLFYEWFSLTYVNFLLIIRGFYFIEAGVLLINLKKKGRTIFLWLSGLFGLYYLVTIILYFSGSLENQLKTPIVVKLFQVPISEISYPPLILFITFLPLMIALIITLFLVNKKSSHLLSKN